MSTAILSALPQEQAGLHSQLQHARTERVAGRAFHGGQLQGQSVVLALCGIGKVAAATTATLLAKHFGVQRIVFTGVAGGLAAQVRVGDVVLGSRYLQHDMDASPLFPRYEVPLYQRAYFDADADWFAIVLRAACAVLTTSVGQNDSKLLPKVHQGLIVSGDRFVSSAAESRALQAALPDALCVEMEGAAVAQVCHDFALPFVAVRSISDRADDSAHHDFEQFLQSTAAPLSQRLMMMILQML